MTDTPRPHDDLYRHVNGTWLATHEIPADRGRDGAFHALVDAAEMDVREIIEDCAGGVVDVRTLVAATHLVDARPRRPRPRTRICAASARTRRRVPRSAGL